MSNLITIKQSNVVKREYFLRLVGTGLIMIASLGLFLLCYLLPYNFILSKQDLIVSSQLDASIKIENQENKGQSSSRVVAQVSSLLAALKKDYSETPLLEIINQTVKLKPAGVSLIRFNLLTVEEGKTLALNGIADDRDSLINYLSSLKNSGRYVSVESPISDFAKYVDIPFTINLKLAQ